MLENYHETTAFLKQNLRKNINLINFMENNSVHDIRRVGESVLVHGESDRSWVCISSSREEEVRQLLQTLSENDRNFAALEDWILPIVSAGREVVWKLSTVQYVLPDSIILPKPGISSNSLSVKDAQWIFTHSDYKNYISQEYIEDCIQRGPSAGIIADGKLAAWGMTQDDGAIGFLHVLKNYRRRGYARSIALALVEKVRAAGKLPFAYIEPENRSSTALFLNLGFERDKVIHWFEVKHYVK